MNFAADTNARIRRGDLAGWFLEFLEGLPK
jgi:hypothetical protein